MIDSAGNTVLKANGTIFDILPISRVLLLLGSLLVGLFTLIKPEASHGLNGFWRIVFWSLHIGVGLFALWVSSSWLRRGQYLPGNTWMAVALTGLCGIAVAAPAYLALDKVFAPYVIDLDVIHQPTETLPPLATEIIDVSPWFMLTWLLINLPVLLPKANHTVSMDDTVNALNSNHAINNDSKTQNLDTESTDARSQQPLQSQQFLESLPGIVGTDIVAIASDLHYLNIWTVAGKTTVLGNLRDAMEELGEQGMQIHRSHWVAHRHVRRIVGNANSAACILSNELKVPISRRRWKEVREFYGRGVVNINHSD